MNRSNHATLALLSALTIGLVNVASLSVIYVMYHDAHKPTESAFATGTTNAPNTSVGMTGGSTDIPSQSSVQTNGSNSTTNTSNPSAPTTTNQPAQTGNPNASGSSGTSSTKSSGGSMQKPSGSGSGSTPTSGSGSTSPPPPTTPNSLAKGAPCKTQIPPAGVCKAVLSFNTQKDGNPYWSPSLLTGIKQGIANDSFVQLLGLNPTTIYNQMTVTINESTWNGNATHGTIGGTMNAQGQSQATTFTLDWQTDKWVVDDAAQN